MESSESTGKAAPDRLYGMTRAELARWIERYAAPGFHAGQIYRWLYARAVLDPAGWTDLPRALRERIAAEADLTTSRIDQRAEAADGTVKYRLRLGDGEAVEAVYMVQSGRVTLCLSSQVGCALACDFCLTARMGLRRHLAVGEILDQVRTIRAERALGDRPFNIVFMGMGEPLHNYDAVVGATAILCDAEGFGLSRRRITVSTSGLAPAIERLAEEPVRPRLAVSLNATTDELRDRLMPINRKYPIARLLEACRAYARATGERFTLEYVLLRGVNDSARDVERLARIASGLPAKLNLIPFNAVEGWLPYGPPERADVLRVRDRLLEAGVRASIRWSRGADARAACGQLALLEAEPAGRPGRKQS